MAAAQLFGGAAGVGFDVPKEGWVVLEVTREGARIQSGDVVLHAIQGGDGTWFIDSGNRCA